MRATVSAQNCFWHAWACHIKMLSWISYNYYIVTVICFKSVTTKVVHELLGFGASLFTIILWVVIPPVAQANNNVTQ